MPQNTFDDKSISVQVIVPSGSKPIPELILSQICRDMAHN